MLSLSEPGFSGLKDLHDLKDSYDLTADYATQRPLT